MTPSGPEDAQSFLLRFWYERSQIITGFWRGTVWDQQLDQEANHRPVASPEEAFELIRRALERATPHAVPAKPQQIPADRGGASGTSVSSDGSLWTGLARILCRMIGRS